MMVIFTRGQIVKWALQSVNVKSAFQYEEIRPLPLTWPPNLTKTDCSFFVKLVYYRAGAPDPTGLNYDGYGNSVSLFQHGRHILLRQAKHGDVIVFGPEGSVHAVVIVQSGPDPLCASMGKPGDPNLVRMSECLSLGQPTFLRFNTINRRFVPKRK